MYKNSTKPFGGIDVLACGDLFQLPPVVKQHEEREIYDKYDSVYFFDALSFKDIDNVKYFQLDKSFRQDESNYQSRVILPYDTDQTATKQPSSSWYLPTKNNFSSWTSNNSDNLIKIRIGRSNNIMNIFQSSSKANGNGTDKIQLFLAIGLHNSYSKYIGIPQATNKLFE